MGKDVLVMMIRFYQKAISPGLPRSCQILAHLFDYAIEAIQRYGITKGLLKAAIRVLKCNPFHPWYDRVEHPKET